MNNTKTAEEQHKEQQEKIKKDILKKNLPSLLKVCRKSLHEIRNPHTAKELYRQMNSIMIELNKLDGDGKCQN